jgi:hypothetical protein
MNPNNNHLVANVESINERIRNEYDQIPEHLNRAARRKLAGRSEAFVSKTSGGKLSKHAAGLRKKKRQAAKAARRSNRNHAS